jgi:alcohol dehydrogenase, propanol-preferring
MASMISPLAQLCAVVQQCIDPYVLPLSSEEKASNYVHFSNQSTKIVECGLRPGSWAAILGAGGGVGHMGVQLATAMGLRVIGVDGGNEKRDLCLRLGCEAFVDFTTSNAEEEVKRISGGNGVNGVFVTATSSQAYRAATRMVSIGGKVMCIGMPPAGTTLVGDDPMFIMLRNIKIIGTLTGSLQDTSDALSFAVRGLLKPEYECFGIDELPEAVAKLASGRLNGRCVVDFNI